MKHVYIALTLLAAAALPTAAQTVYTTDYPVIFNPLDPGESKPVLWGIDMAWRSEANVLRSIRYMTPEVIGCARVSFTPYRAILTPGVLPDTLQQILDGRMDLVNMIGHKVDICLNLDGGNQTDWATYKNNPLPWCRLFDATAAAVQAKGYNVASVAPFNEPDLADNNTSLDEFVAIAKELKSDNAATLYPHLKGVRLSGPNVLNPDFAMPWYDELKPYLDEGNTHQLAGWFYNYAGFFEQLRNDGMYATADELHNIMDCMVGSHYGMQEGIWWGAAELTRGMFCQATAGQRLAYAENRKAWSSASVYRHPDGRLLAFVGQSERQGWPCVYHFLSPSRDLYFNGQGPLRHFPVWLPGDVDHYQTALMKNAEGFYNIGLGEDIQPEINGTYAIVNRATSLAITPRGASLADLNPLTADTYTQSSEQQWRVMPAPNDIGLDFSYWLITNASDTTRTLDLLNFDLRPGADIICFADRRAGNQQWGLEYAGNGLFRLLNRHSALYLQPETATPGARLTQAERSDDPSQLWSFMPLDVSPEFDAPQAPTSLSAQPLPDAVALIWAPSASSDVVSYDILRTDNEGGTDSPCANTIARGIPSCSFVDNTAKHGFQYTYKVRANDRCGNRSEASVTADATPTDDPALRASFLLDNALADLSVNDFKIQSQKAPTYEEGAVAGANALTLDGSQWLTLPPALLQLPRFSLSLWAKGTYLNNLPVIFSSGLGDINQGLRLQFAKSGTPSLYVNSLRINGKRAAVGAWRHLVVVVDGTKFQYYNDGELCGEGAADDFDPNLLLLTYLGRSHDLNDSKTLTGAAADLRVYNYPLSLDEVSSLYSQGAGLENINVSTPTVRSVEYFNLQGQPLTAPASQGITLRRTTLSDGSSSVDKLVR